MKQELKIPHHAKPVLSRLRQGGHLSDNPLRQRRQR